MGSAYAGILGPISFGTVIARALIDGLTAESAITTACAALFAFAAVGYIVGTLAERIVVEGIESRFRAEWRGTLASETGSPTVESNQSTASVA